MKRLILTMMALISLPHLPAFGNDTRDQLVGVWELKSFTVTNDRWTQAAWCPGVHGLLIYTADGHVSAAINCASETEDSPSRILGGKLLYAGTFEVSGRDAVHHVVNASAPGFVGRTLVRRIDYLDHDYLVLSGQSSYRFEIKWKRAGSGTLSH